MGRKINPILLALLVITIIGAVAWWQTGGKSQVPISYYLYKINNGIGKEINNILNDFSVSTLAVKNPTATPQTKNSIYGQTQVLDVFYKGKTATSQYGKQVLNYLDYLNFPASLRQGLIIVIASPDFTSQVFYYENRELPFKKPTDSYPASITQICSGSNCLNLVAMKSDYFPSNFYATLAHELGHAIGESLTAEDWQKWKTLRGNPVSSTFGVFDKEWQTSQVQDFAEVYKIIFGNHQGSGWENKTLYGKKLCTDIYPVGILPTDTPIEKMRKTIEWQITIPSKDSDCSRLESYKDIQPNKATKDFMNQLLLRLL